MTATSCVKRMACQKIGNLRTGARTTYSQRNSSDIATFEILGSTEEHASTQENNTMLNRRRVIGLLGGVAAFQIADLTRPSDADAQSRINDLVKGSMGSGKSFSRQAVLSIARELAKKPYSPPNVPLVDPFNGLNAEQYNAITTKAETAIWAGENRGIDCGAAPSWLRIRRSSPALHGRGFCGSQRLI